MEFDPLKNTEQFDTDIINAAKKREIRNILKSYVGIYDSFSELIQNAMDAVDKKAEVADDSYKKKIWIRINLKENLFSITDNGIGFSQQEFQVLRPKLFDPKSPGLFGSAGPKKSAFPKTRKAPANVSGRCPSDTPPRL